MPQSRLYFETDELTAKRMLPKVEFAFEEDGYPISAFEDPEAKDKWTVSIYAETEDIAALEPRLQSILSNEKPPINISREDIPDIDWVAETLRDLSSVRAGRFIVHGSHERHVPKSNEIGICIDAGLAFGTGHHGTTAGCLDMLSKVSKKTDFYNALDLGTGSGVLAIAIAKTHQASVLATDIDPVSVITAADNARINQVHSSVECLTANGFGSRRFKEQAPFDLVVANILANPLMSMSLDIANHTAHGGTIILSGLLPHQRTAILATFRIHNLIHEYSYIRDGWLTLILKKP